MFFIYIKHQPYNINIYIYIYVHGRNSLKPNVRVKMFSLHKSRAFLLILSAVYAPNSSIHSQLTYNDHICLYQSNETSNTNYQSNLTVLLKSLSSKASQNYNFYNKSSSIGIYALFLCRGDVSNSTCQSCVSYVIQNITTRCPSNKTAIIWFDQCMLRYSNVNFFGQTQISPMSLMYNTQNTTTPELTNFYALGLLYDLIDRAKVTDMLFKSDSQTVQLSDGSKISYGLVQCTRDIDAPSCGQCLSYLMDTVETCCQAKIGWHILGPSCFLRYENYSFTEQSPAKPLPLPLAQSMPAATMPPTINGKTCRFGIFIEILLVWCTGFELEFKIKN